MKNFRKVCRGEGGFTLIELLVVIMILGVLAAVVTLAVTKFIGKGTLESANAELVTVQASVESAMGAANSGTLVGTLTAWDGTTDGPTGPYAAGSSENTSVYSMMRTHHLKASYTFNSTGDVTTATCAAAGQWGSSITWDAANGKWKKA